MNPIVRLWRLSERIAIRLITLQVFVVLVGAGGALIVGALAALKQLVF